MLALKGEMISQVQIGSNLDTVLQAIDIPAGCTLQKVDIQVDLVSLSVSVERENAAAYAAKAMVITEEDPDSRVDYDVLLDRFLPKYTDAELINLDTTAAVVTPFWEPGEGSFEDVFDMGNTPMITFSRKKLLNFASPGSSGYRFQPSETPFEVQWFPADTFHVRQNKGIRVKRPSVYLLAIASPAFDDTATTRSQLSGNQWGQIQYAEATLERALMEQLALLEAGAESPWEEASVVFRQYLAPQTLEITDGAFATESWKAWVKCNWTLLVPGRLAIQSVDLTP